MTVAAPSPTMELHVKVNGESKTFTTSLNKSIFDVLRAEGYVDVKNGCLVGDCGSCAIMLDGRPILACCVMAPHCEGMEILTCAGLGRAGDLHPLQTAFLDHGAAQCGFCTPGILIAAKYLLDQNPKPTDDEIRAALAGNLCRCTGYVKIIDAVRDAAKKMNGKKKGVTKRAKR